MMTEPTGGGGRDRLKSGQELLREAKAEIDDLAPAEAAKLAEQGAVMVDVRESEEWRGGHIPGAVHLPRGYLEMQADTKLPDPKKPLIVYCAGGNRSAFAARTLKQLGFGNVSHLRGGYSAWRNAGLKVETPRKWTENQRDRYSRHFVLPEVGEKGQQAIAEASILVVGAGGLGSPVLYYLAAAGVGKLGIVDFDAVEENNLQRQIIHATSRIGENKAKSAAGTIADLNPDVETVVFDQRITGDNVVEILGEFDMVIDATDNFSTRYMLNEICFEMSKPYIYGSIYRFEGYSTVFWPAAGGGPCYRCLHPEAPPDALAPT